jgi:glutamate racemase
VTSPTDSSTGGTSALRQAPIGIFDSGIGGLTVAAAVRRILPAERILYVGDTARVPYGGKSRRTIERYAVEIGGLLLAEGAKALIVACNTASALALPRMQEVFKVPVLGVVEPGARAACTVSQGGRIGVIATRATVASRAYEHAIHAIKPDAQISAAACPLLVPLVEEGLFDDPITDMALARYLAPLLAQGMDTLVLGCTHYPLASRAIAKAAGKQVRLVDSADNCAAAAASLLAAANLLAPITNQGSLDVALTDPGESFLRTAERSLGLDIGEVQILTVQQPHP